MSKKLDHILIAIPEVKKFIIECLKIVGAKPNHAEIMSEVLVSADYRGHFSHGLNRLELYVKDFKGGVCRSDKEPEIVNETVSTALVEGHSLLGGVVGKFAMDLAIEKAKNTGIGLVTVRGSNHFGIAGWYSMRALEQGMIGFAATNASPLIPPTRTTTRVFGTNPLSVAAPAANGDSYVLDMATSAVALGKLEVQYRKGEPIPLGWAMNAEGKATTDSAEAMKASTLFPLGGEEANSGYKGYGLAMMVDLLSGVLSGASYAHHIRDWTNTSTLANLGQVFLAINTGVFATGFQDRMSDVIDHCRNLPPVDPSKPVLVPGDPEKRHMAVVDADGGIHYHKNVIHHYDELAKQLNVPQMKR
ncbi:hypothetical protein CHUAL_009368 [Chamberlinius hualienensis]